MISLASSERLWRSRPIVAEQAKACQTRVARKPQDQPSNIGLCLRVNSVRSISLMDLSVARVPETHCRNIQIIQYVAPGE